ncbi:M23 family metallopeptidase [Microbacterium sp.]|uniref:M23 family metallopeptidase n=1 Tax=Microbacterium sp. TaxID=51671 RepID=UPI0033419F97
MRERQRFVAGAEAETPMVDREAAAEVPLSSEGVVFEPAAPRDDASDRFSAAAEAFGFGGHDTFVASAPRDPAEDAPAPAHQASRRPRVMRKVAAAGATLGVMGIAGLIAVSMTLPAAAVAGVQGDGAQAVATLAATEQANKASDAEIQAYVASSDVKNEEIVRPDDYSTVSLVDLAAEEGIKYSDSLYTNDPEASIQWPFAVGVSMSSPYGTRWGRLHAGIDLVPGNGAPIQAIADGVVRQATESGGGYGVTIYIDHMIDGKLVTSHYAHMQHGSMRVKTGDHVKVGQVIGLVGNTGHSYGAHLHFEIIINGSPIDPLPWMRKNAGRHDGVTPVS